MTLATSLRPYGRVESTSIHHDFWPLHARLSGPADLTGPGEVAFKELVETEVQPHAFFALYPVALEGYEPFLRWFFANPVRWQELMALPTMKRYLVDTCAVMMMDTQHLSAVYAQNFDAAKLSALINDLLLPEYFRNPRERSEAHAKLRGTFKEVFETMLLLHAWGHFGYANLPPKDQQALSAHIAGLRAFFCC